MSTMSEVIMGGSEAGRGAQSIGVGVARGVAIAALLVEIEGVERSEVVKMGEGVEMAEEGTGGEDSGVGGAMKEVIAEEEGREEVAGGSNVSEGSVDEVASGSDIDEIIDGWGIEELAAEGEGISKEGDTVVIGGREEASGEGKREEVLGEKGVDEG